ncbi:MAG: hypothetical protein ACLR23_12805 [Clostridia bacterium]
MLRNRTPEFKAYILSELVKNVWPKIEDGTIKPSIYKVLPIIDAEAAHAILERGENVERSFWAFVMNKSKTIWLALLTMLL